MGLMAVQEDMVLMAQERWPGTVSNAEASSSGRELATVPIPAIVDSIPSIYEDILCQNLRRTARPPDTPSSLLPAAARLPPKGIRVWKQSFTCPRAPVCTYAGCQVWEVRLDAQDPAPMWLLCAWGQGLLHTSLLVPARGRHETRKLQIMCRASCTPRAGAEVRYLLQLEATFPGVLTFVSADVIFPSSPVVYRISTSAVLAVTHGPPAAARIILRFPGPSVYRDVCLPTSPGVAVMQELRLLDRDYFKFLFRLVKDVSEQPFLPPSSMRRTEPSPSQSGGNSAGSHPGSPEPMSGTPPLARREADSEQAAERVMNFACQFLLRVSGACACSDALSVLSNTQRVILAASFWLMVLLPPPSLSLRSCRKAGSVGSTWNITQSPLSSGVRSALGSPFSSKLCS